MGKNLTGIAVGEDGITAVSSVTENGRVKLVASWRDGRVLDMASPSAIRDRLVELLDSSGLKRTAVAVSLPDTMARVEIVDFQELPSGKDAALLVRAGTVKSMGITDSGWMIDSQLFDVASGKRALSAAIKNEGLETVSEAFEAAGLKVRGAGLHSFNIANLLPPGDEGGALIARCAGFVTVVFFRAGVPDFYRCKPISLERNEAEREVAASFAFYNGKNPELSKIKVYLADETGCLGASLPASIREDLVLVGPEFANSGPLPAGALSALGAGVSNA